MTTLGTNPPLDFMAKARPRLAAFAQSSKTPVVIPSPTPLPQPTLDAAKQSMNGICPGGYEPVCTDMAVTVIVLMPDGTAVEALLVRHCKCEPEFAAPSPGNQHGGQPGG